MRMIRMCHPPVSDRCGRCGARISGTSLTSAKTSPMAFYVPCGHAANTYYEDTLTPEEIAVALLMLEDA